MKRLRPLLAAALLLFAAGCKSASYRESAAPAPDASYAAGGEAAPAEAMADYDFDDGGPSGDYVRREIAEEARPEPVTGTASTALGAPPPPPKPAPARTPADLKEKDKAPVATPGSGEDKDKEPQKQFARQIIYTAEMVISCFKLDDAMQRAETLTLESGGYVQTMSQGYFVLRIPAAQLRRIMDELGKLGVVESRSLQAQDVTQEYVDLTTRIRVLRETQTQLIALLKQARNVEEALQVRRSLDTITMELEQAMGRLRMLENLIGFSTLTLRLSERGPQNAIPSSNDPFPWVDTLGVEATEWN